LVDLPILPFFSHSRLQEVNIGKEVINWEMKNREMKNEKLD